jgi:radical SAM superfamily enzyme YgiQ (UPF0313 family)
MERQWVALVGPELEENLGLRYLASALALAGFQSRILVYSAPDDFSRVLQAIVNAPRRPFLVALSLAVQFRAMEFLALATALREKGYAGHLTAGGHFGTFMAPQILADFPELDSICRHEAEEIIVELARALESGSPLAEVRGLASRTPQGEPLVSPFRAPPDLSTVPWPDRRGEPQSCLGHRIATLVSSRGCYANCAFCCIAAWHEQTLPGKRYRARPLSDVAKEMAWLHHDHQVDIFIFHDDNFFVLDREESLARIVELSSHLREEGVGRFATVVKARPTDVHPEVLRAMQEQLGCVRVFLGVETHATRGLRTLRRGVKQPRNQAALELLESLGLYVCFNMLIFDPDTTRADLETNLAFMEEHADTPFNFGRAELYAGTPLLERMLEEGRCRGDYLGWDYSLASPEIQQVFDIAMQCFFERNFAAGAMANRLMGTRFDVEVCRFFHPDVYRAEWLSRAQQLSHTLALDSISGLRAIMEFVGRRAAGASSEEFADELSRRLRATEQSVRAAATALEQEVQTATGRRCVHYRPVPRPELSEEDMFPVFGRALSRGPQGEPRDGEETFF